MFKVGYLSKPNFHLFQLRLFCNARWRRPTAGAETHVQSSHHSVVWPWRMWQDHRRHHATQPHGGTVSIVSTLFIRRVCFVLTTCHLQHYFSSTHLVSWLTSLLHTFAMFNALMLWHTDSVIQFVIKLNRKNQWHPPGIKPALNNSVSISVIQNFGNLKFKKNCNPWYILCCK